MPGQGVQGERVPGVAGEESRPGAGVGRPVEEECGGPVEGGVARGARVSGERGHRHEEPRRSVTEPVAGDPPSWSGSLRQPGHGRFGGALPCGLASGGVRAEGRGRCRGAVAAPRGGPACPAMPARHRWSARLPSRATRGCPGGPVQFVEPRADPADRLRLAGDGAACAGGEGRAGIAGRVMPCAIPLLPWPPGGQAAVRPGGDRVHQPGRPSIGSVRRTR